MPVTVIWDDEAKTTLRQVYEGNLALDDYYVAVDAFLKLAETEGQGRIIHSIMDRTLVKSSPSGAIRAMQYGNKKLEHVLGITVVLKPNLMVRFIVDMGKRVAPALVRKLFYADNLEDARAIISRETQSVTVA